MAAALKWKVDELFLGATKMAAVFQGRKNDLPAFFYVLGRGDRTSDVYENKDDARQDCEAEVRRLLKKAGA